MNILSFTYWAGSHDTAAALVCDGRIVAAVEEERLSRKRHDDALPVRAIDYCLAAAGVAMRDIDCIAFPGKPFQETRRKQTSRHRFAHDAEPDEPHAFRA